MVFTSASLVKDEVLAIEGNQSLVRNTVDYVWQREDNLNIGTKSLAAAEGMEVQRTIVAAVSIAFIPMFIVAIGIWAIAGRNKKRR